MDAYASAKQELGNLVSSPTVASGANEATTRMQLIDALLFNCLGWHPQETVAEEHYNGTYVDYAVGKPSAHFILEAKKEGISFDLPAGIRGRHSVSLKTLLDNADAAKAIRQVLGYCQERGVPVAVASNGHQLIAFLASRQDGIPPLEGEALVFSSLQEMHDDFNTLWSHLSKPGVIVKNLQRTFARRDGGLRPPEKLSSLIQGYPGFRPRTALETDLKTLGQLFIQDLGQEQQVADDFVERCYCTSGALSQYALVSKEILRSRYSLIEKNANVKAESVTTKRGVNPKLSAEVVTTALSRRPIVLLGDVGVGKSMFLQHFMRVYAKDLLNKMLVLYINFVREPAFSVNLSEYIARRLHEQLDEKYGIDINEGSFVRSVYNRELNKFKKTIEGELYESDPVQYKQAELRLLKGHLEDKAEHLRRSLEYVRATSQRSPLIVFDNIDQRPREFQEEIFATAHSVASTWPGTVFVSLRPSTFFESRSRGPLAAFQTRAFTVEPARVDKVILSRLEYAKSKIVEAHGIGAYPDHLSINADDLAIYMDTLIRAFTMDEELKELVDNLSGGNLRACLQFLYTFIGSGYVSTRRVIEAAGTGRLYTVPMHEFIRAIIYGDYENYDPKSSPICNLFDISVDDGREHFLLPSILAFVQKTGESAGGDGYVSTASVHSFGTASGFSQEQVGYQLERAFSERLLVANSEVNESLCRITSVGSYMYRKLIATFSYLDAVVIDTPITQLQTRAQIKPAMPILERLDRAELFKEYLDSQWSLLARPDISLPFDWTEVSSLLDSDLESARWRAETAVRRRREADYSM